MGTTLMAVYLIIFSIGSDSAVRFNAFKMASMENCLTAVQASKLEIPTAGDMEVSGGMVCVDSLEGYAGYWDVLRVREP